MYRINCITKRQSLRIYKHNVWRYYISVHGFPSYKSRILAVSLCDPASSRLAPHPDIQIAPDAGLPARRYCVYLRVACSYAYMFSNSISLRDDFLFIVGSTVLANSVWEHKLAALRACYKIKRSHFPVSSSLISVSLRGFVLRTDRHLLTPPNAYQLSLFYSYSNDYTHVLFFCQQK